MPPLIAFLTLFLEIGFERFIMTLSLFDRHIHIKIKELKKVIVAYSILL